LFSLLFIMEFIQFYQPFTLYQLIIKLLLFLQSDFQV
jgi:hypothetical protein